MCVAVPKDESKSESWSLPGLSKGRMSRGPVRQVQVCVRPDGHRDVLWRLDGPAADPPDRLVVQQKEPGVFLQEFIQSNFGRKKERKGLYLISLNFNKIKLIQ